MVSRDVRLNCGKMSYLAILKCSSKNPGSGSNDFQNLISYFLSNDTSVVKFSWRSDQ